MAQKKTTDIQAPEPTSTLAGLPLYIFDQSIEDVDETIKAIRDSGQNIFFLLADQKVVQEHKPKQGKPYTTTSHQPRLFKVVSNLVGNAISAVDTAEVGLQEVEQLAYFTLPPIPWQLIMDIDAFFRRVHEKYKTEAIVLFTFDPSYLGDEGANDSDGWGVLIPKQENTAGSCDYEPQSVVDDKPDEVYIVGSAHSHPGMEAFCSGTDKADQAEFDGIHITFGWKRNSTLTDHHIELQMGGASYTLSANHAFADMPLPEVTEDIEKWVTDKVSKKYTTSSSSSSSASLGYGGHGYGWSDPDYSKLPDDLPLPSTTHTIIAMPLLSSKELKDCPVCQVDLSDYAVRSGKCTTCQSYFVTTDVGTIERLIEVREKELSHSAWVDDLRPDGTQRKNIWLWREALVDEGEGKQLVDEVTLLSEGTVGKKDEGKVHGKFFSRA